MISSFISGTMLEMTWTEIRQYAEKDTAVLFPIAVVEEHGPHMPVSVDIYLSYLLARETQKRLRNSGIDSIIAPPFYWGVNGSTKHIPGSFYATRETVVAILTDMFISLKSWGFNKIVAFSGHGESDHLSAIDDALKAVDEGTSTGVYMRAPSFGVSNYNDDDDDTVDDHAGATETSIMLDYFSDNVNSEMLNSLVPTEVTYKDYSLWQKGGEYFNKTTPLGYLGDPASAAPGIGKRLIEKYMEGSIRAIVERLK